MVCMAQGLSNMLSKEVTSLIYKSSPSQTKTKKNLLQKEFSYRGELRKKEERPGLHRYK